MILVEVIDKLAFKLKKSPSKIKKVYELYWLFIKKYIENQHIDLYMTEEEFQKLKPNINVPRLGKFYCSWEFIQKLKKQKENAKYKKSKTS